jgi:voltage-gated potassium channel
MNSFRRLLPSIIIVLIVVVVGTLGYIVIEGWPLLDAVYMVIITLFTVGYQEMHKLSQAGMIFTMFIIVAGVGSAIYAAGQVVEIMVEGEIFGSRRRNKMEKKIKDLKNHYIICGFGRTGHQVADEFAAAKVPYVIIDRRAEISNELDPKGVLYVVGDIISDESLESAGIKSAKALVACADSDVANVYVTLSARALNPDLYIITRSSEKDTEKKLKMAGANRVISPYLISGRRMAAWATRPVASDFLDMVMHGGESLEFNLREITVPDNSTLIDRSLAETEIRQKSGAMVLAIRKEAGSFNLQPQAGSRIAKGDIFVVIGTQEQLELLENMV